MPISKKEDFPFENSPKIKKKVNFLIKDKVRRFEFVKWTESLKKSMNEPDQTFAKSLSLQKIFIAKRLLPPNKLFLKSYISSRNRTFLDILPDVESYLLVRRKIRSQLGRKSNFISAINTKATPADTNKKTERHNKRLRRQ